MSRFRRSGVTAAVLAAALVVAGAGGAAADPERPGMVRDGGGSGVWLLRDALSAGPATTSFPYGPGYGVAYLTGDWDGNGTRTPAVVREVGGLWTWYLRNSTSAGPADVRPFAYGARDLDFPVAGDWDGDGRDTVGVIRVPTLETDTLRWLLRDATTAGPPGHDFRFGLRNGFPLVGDWDGNGTDTPGLVFRTFQQPLQWRLRNANSAGPTGPAFLYGSADDVPVVGNWDGSGPAGIGVLRDERGIRRWLLRQTGTPGGAQYSFRYGTTTNNIPVVWS